MNEHKNIITIEDEIKEFSDKPVKSSALFKALEEKGVPDSSAASVGDVLTKGEAGGEWKPSRKLYSHNIEITWGNNSREKGHMFLVIVSASSTPYSAYSLEDYFIDRMGQLRDFYPASGTLTADENGIACKLIVAALRLFNDAGRWSLGGTLVDFTNGSIAFGVKNVALRDAQSVIDDVREI